MSLRAKTVSTLHLRLSFNCVSFALASVENWRALRTSSQLRRVSCRLRRAVISAATATFARSKPQLAPTKSVDKNCSKLNEKRFQTRAPKRSANLESKFASLFFLLRNFERFFPFAENCVAQLMSCVLLLQFLLHFCCFWKEPCVACNCWSLKGDAIGGIWMLNAKRCENCAMFFGAIVCCCFRFSIQNSRFSCFVSYTFSSFGFRTRVAAIRKFGATIITRSSIICSQQSSEMRKMTKLGAHDAEHSCQANKRRAFRCHLPLIGALNVSEWSQFNYATTNKLKSSRINWVQLRAFHCGRVFSSLSRRENFSLIVCRYNIFNKNTCKNIKSFVPFLHCQKATFFAAPCRFFSLSFFLSLLLKVWFSLVCCWLQQTLNLLRVNSRRIRHSNWRSTRYLLARVASNKSAPHSSKPSLLRNESCFLLQSSLAAIFELVCFCKAVQVCKELIAANLAEKRKSRCFLRASQTTVHANNRRPLANRCSFFHAICAALLK